MHCVRWHSTHKRNPNNKAMKLSLSHLATSAIKDFKTQLSYLGNDVLDETTFNALLDHIGYKRSREGLFESLLAEVGSFGGEEEKKSDSATRCVTVEGLTRLYESELYHLLDNGKDSGDALMEYADKLFQKCDVDSSGNVTKEKFQRFFHELTGEGKEAADEAFTQIDVDKNGILTASEFKEAILKSNKNQSTGLPSNLNYNIFSPTLTTDENFITALEIHAKNHGAVTHHLIENIACAAFGKKQTADVILIFLSAYTKFNFGFVNRIQKLIQLLDDPRERNILRENVKEEMGFYDEETLEECEKLGIPRDTIENIPHHELFLQLIKTIEGKVKCSYLDYIPSDLYSAMVNAQNVVASKGKVGLLASLYFGSELIVPFLYSSLLIGLRLCLGLTPVEARFLTLHIDLDAGHAAEIRSIILTHCTSTEDRIEFAKCTEMILNARVAFYDKLVSLNNSLSTHEQTSTLYNKQASNWSRDKPRCLSDFTGRPVVYELLSDHIKGASVLDVGCGEGFVSRKMTEMGAAKVVGMDVSPGMIQLANCHEKKSRSEHFLVGDARELKQQLIDQSSKANIMLGANFDIGTFDLAVAVFLFNYMPISGMHKTFEDIYSLLKPGGHFVFSVPHPFILHHSSDIFGFHGDIDKPYFAMRDQVLDGHISTLDGTKLNVRMNFKTIEDYFKAAMLHGFKIISFKECRVRAEDMASNKAFFNAVNGYPLHIVMKIQKPPATSDGVSLGQLNTLDLLPKKLNWPRTITNNVNNSLVMQIPPDVNFELVAVSLQLYSKGMTADDFDTKKSIWSEIGQQFTATKRFAATVRRRLLHETGAVLVRGLGMSDFGGVGELDKMTTCSKLAYLIFCECIGTVDSTARGKLFDVKSANLDAMSEQADNVLFSVSDTEAGWHTDGASKDRVYDVASLLCISPATTGGKFRISNACDVYDELIRILPKFLMYELLRPIPRDILENGSGRGAVGAAMSLSRSKELLAMRIKYNTYPIYLVEGDRMRFRYMRHWIETGHAKTTWKVPTLLRIAMDVLDDHLDDACCFYQALERGDMIYANNALICHARDQFKDAPGAPPRHKVRAWIQIQKADALEEEPKEDTALVRRRSSLLEMSTKSQKEWELM